MRNKFKITIIYKTSQLKRLHPDIAECFCEYLVGSGAGQRPEEKYADYISSSFSGDSSFDVYHAGEKFDLKRLEQLVVIESQDVPSINYVVELL